MDVTDYWQSEELAPCKALITQGYDGMVMMSLVQRRFMPSGEPAGSCPSGLCLARRAGLYRHDGDR